MEHKITIIFAPPRYGKTSYMTDVLNEYAYDRERYLLMSKAIDKLNSNGFKLTVPDNPCSANYDIHFRKFGYSRRYNRRINPFKLGYSNNFVKDVHYSFPFEVIAITEAQKYFNSRMSMYYPEWQSRYFEQHGHNDLDFYFDTQRPDLIDLNIRSLASFVEIVEKRFVNDEFGCPSGMVWRIRTIDNIDAYNCYVSSGKRDKDCYVESERVSAPGILNCYDSQLCKPKFHDGHFFEDFDILKAEEQEQTIDGYINYLKKYDDEMPKDFYVKRGGKNEFVKNESVKKEV